MELSNTWILEAQFGWSGILVEPARMWSEDLQQNRSAHIETSALWSATGEELLLLEASVLSTLKAAATEDNHARAGSEYPVTTISPRDLLAKYEAPYQIDFLSIDTEGSELEILFAFPFSEFRVQSICVEHNFTKMESSIDNFLVQNGFVRVLRQISSIDAWFVRNDNPSLQLLQRLG